MKTCSIFEEQERATPRAESGAQKVESQGTEDYF